MAWAHRNRRAARALRKADDRGAEDARLHPDRPMSEPLQRVLRADEPLTLAGVPTGFLPWLAADLARAAHGDRQGGRAVVIVADEAAMRALAETAPLFAPEVEVLTLPGWDCLPYDRASPALRVMAERLATLSALQAKHDKPQLLVATATAATQRLLTPFRVRQLTRRIAEGERIDREALIAPAQRARLPAQRHGRRAWRICGARIADRPVPGRRGAGASARLLRRRDRQPAPLRPRRPALDRQGRRLHADAGVRSAARRGNDQALPLRATARNSAPPRPRTRSTRRCPKAGG